MTAVVLDGVATATAVKNELRERIEQLKAKGMKVQAPSPALAAGFKKAGEQLTADWLKKAGAEGQTIVDAYKKM